MTKIKKALGGQIPANQTKFLTMKDWSKQLYQKLINKARAFAGIKLDVINLDIADEKLIAYYQLLFPIEDTS